MPVKRFRYLLDQISAQTGYSDQDIADMTVVAQKRLRVHGKHVNLLKLMEEAWTVLALKSGAKYEEILAALVVIGADQ